jgi:hypothetical protein
MIANQINLQTADFSPAWMPQPSSGPDPAQVSAELAGCLHIPDNYGRITTNVRSPFFFNQTGSADSGVAFFPTVDEARQDVALVYNPGYLKCEESLSPSWIFPYLGAGNALNGPVSVDAASAPQLGEQNAAWVTTAHFIEQGIPVTVSSLQVDFTVGRMEVALTVYGNDVVPQDLAKRLEQTVASRAAAAMHTA